MLSKCRPASVAAAGTRCVQCEEEEAKVPAADPLTLTVQGPDFQEARKACVRRKDRRRTSSRSVFLRQCYIVDALPPVHGFRVLFPMPWMPTPRYNWALPHSGSCCCQCQMIYCGCRFSDEWITQVIIAAGDDVVPGIELLHTPSRVVI